MKNRTLLNSVGLLVLLSGSLWAAPPGTAFTYQGQLTVGTNVASGYYDLRFALYDAVTNGNQVGATLTNPIVSIANGLYLVTLDFGAVFTGEARWLEMGVRPYGMGGDFTILSPRQELMPAPYAQYAPSAGTADTATNLAGALPSGRESTNTPLLSAAANAFAGDIVSSNIFWRGREYLADWNANIASIRNGASTVAKIAFIGDSWATWGWITRPLATNLQNHFGDSGDGFCGFTNYWLDLTPRSRVGRVGTWTDSHAASGPNLYSYSTTDNSTPARINLTNTYVTAFVIHYLKRNGGGTFTFAVDGGATTTVDTSAASDIYATTNVSAGASGSHYLTITKGDSSVVTLYGVDCQNSAKGVRLHNLGLSGAATLNFTSATSNLWTAGLAALNPNVVMIMLGVNDKENGVVPASYQANILSLVQRARAAAPNADIVLVSPADTGTARTYTIWDYATKLESLALQNRLSYLDVYRYFGPYALSNARGLMYNTTHVNAPGGRLIADLATSFLVEANSGYYVKLGIGTANPATALDVVGTVTATSFSGNGRFGSTSIPARGIRRPRHCCEQYWAPTP